MNETKDIHVAGLGSVSRVDKDILGGLGGTCGF